MSDLPFQLTREQLAKFLPDARTVRAFEQLLKAVSVDNPDQIDTITISLTATLIESANAIGKSNDALSRLGALTKLIDQTNFGGPVNNSQISSLTQAIGQLTGLLNSKPSKKLTELDDVYSGTTIPGSLLSYDNTIRRWRPLQLLTLTTQVATPSSTGFNISITSVISSVTYHVWLLLKPTGAFAAGTITLPAVATCLDQQEVTVTCTQSVTTLTVAGNGATVVGAPTTLAANAIFKLRYNFASTTWYIAT